MSPLSIQVLADVQSRVDLSDNNLSGILQIEAAAPARVRKLIIYCQPASPGASEPKRKGAIKITLTRWETWEAGQVYRFPFRIEPDGQMDAQLSQRSIDQWLLLPEIHYVGEFRPDTSAGWLRLNDPGQASPRKEEDAIADEQTSPEELLELNRVWRKQPPLETEQHQAAISDAGSQTNGPPAGADGMTWLATSPVKEDLPEQGVEESPPADWVYVAIKFSRLDRDFHFGEYISGQVIIKPDSDYEVKGLALRYQWRTHGRAELREGDISEITIVEADSWQAGQEYEYPFTFIVEDGPATERGYSQNLDWYVWIEMRLDPEPEAVFGFSQLDFILKKKSLLKVYHAENRGHPPWVVHIAWPIGLLLIPSFIALYFFVLFNVPDLTFEDEDWEFMVLCGFPAIIAGGLAFATFKALAASLTAIRYQLAEMRLGDVQAQIGTLDGKRALTGWITLHPRRKVKPTALFMTLKIREISRVRQGTQVVTKKRWLHRSTETRQLNEVIDPGQFFESDIVMDIPYGLPLSRKSHARTLDWRVELRIALKGWFNWRREYPIIIRSDW